MAATAGETRATDAGDEMPPSESIVLVASPPPADEPPATTQTPPAQEPFASTPSTSQDTAVKDVVFAELASRPFLPLSTPPSPLPAPAASLAGGGGRGLGGVSTPNAGGGGAAAVNSGSGPGVVNANQFAGDSFGTSGGVLTIPTPSTAASNAPGSIPSAAQTAPTVNSSSNTPTPPTAFQTSYSMTAPSLLGRNHFAAPQAQGVNPNVGGDPLYVLDLNTGASVPANVTLNTFSNWSADLLAQVSGATVSSYSWNLSQAPDLANVSGTTTANLQGTWANFSGATRTDTISVTETPQSGSPLTVTMTFAVASTNSPAYSATPPTSSSTWPAVITPDQLLSGQPTQAAGPYANIGEVDGSVQTTFAMPSYNPNTTPVSLDYNSTTANPQPIFLTEYQLPVGQSVPSTITAQLTFNGTALSTVTYSTAGLNPGDIVQLALQADATDLSTGRYPWSITVTNGSTPTTYSGNVDVVNQANSPYGAGWSLDNVSQLVSVSGGVMLVNPDGTSLFFASNGQGGFTTPAGDFSTLVQNEDDSYTRTLTDGTQINFNSSGQETSSVDTNGNTTTFGYTDGLLTSITDMNGQVTTLAYTNGLLTSITDPANRSATLAYTGTQLTSITDAGNNVWSYDYDSANDLTTLTDPNNNTTTFSYNFADRVSSVTQPDNSTEALTAEQMNGLAAPGSGTASNPATAVLLATGDQALFTDANNNVWTTGFDWLGFGVDTADIDPLGDAALNYINTNGMVWLSADALSRATVDDFDSKGNVLEEVAPDDTTQQYQYNAFSEVTQYTNQNDDITSYAYNSDGDLTQETDALDDITTYAYNTAGLVTSTTDANGNTTTYAYNSLNEQTSTTSPGGGVTTSAYDSAGDLLSTTDPLGNVTTYSYNALGWMTGETLPDTPGVYSTYSYTYDKVGNQLSVTDPDNHTTAYTYNAVNEQTSVTNALNQTTTYSYDAVGNLLSVMNPLGQATTYGYNAANEQIKMTDPLGNATLYAYDAAGQQTRVTDPMGNVTVYTYTPRGEVASKAVYQDGYTLVELDYYTYADCGCNNGVTNINTSLVGGSISANVTDTFSGTYTDTVGGSLSGSLTGNFSGNVLNNANQVVGTLSGQFNATLSGSVDSSGNVDGSMTGSGTATLSNGLSGSVVITINGGLSGDLHTSGSGSLSGSEGWETLSGQVSNLGVLSGSLRGGVTVMFSSSNGATLDGTDGGPVTGLAGQQTTLTRNAVDQVTSVTDADGDVMQYSYDKVGNVTSVTDGNGNPTLYSYNAMNQVTSVTNALNQTMTYGYNRLGQLTSVMNPMGDDPTYTYNAQGQVLTATDDDGGVTTYTYDLAGNQTSITDPDGNVTSYSYDAANELLSTTNPTGYRTTYSYNAGGLLTSTTDADGRTINYGYNADGQETSQTWVGGNYTATYGYNADGELTSASDPFSTYTYTYNALGQETSVSNAGTPGVPTVTLNYGYDSFGNRTSLSDSLGGNISYSYNADNELTGLGYAVYSSVYAQVTLAYDGAGNVTGMTRTAPSAGGDTLTTSYSYDQANELTNITDMDAMSGVTLANYTYGYDANGDVTSYQDNSGNALTYGYDADGQLLSATGSLAGSNYTFTYNYDANGNRTSTSTAVNGSVTSATYSTATGNELTSDGTYSYTYDNNGNTLTQTDIATGSVTYYSWDYENRLTEEKVENSQGQVLEDEKFTYDVNDNRIGVSLNGVQQLYTVYDGANPYMDFNGSGTLIERYLTNPNALSQFYGQVSASGTTQWLLTDNLNSIRQVISTNGSSLDAITYDPYGNILSQTNAANAPRFLYTGAAYDSITGTYLDDARVDKPQDGRWQSPDPLGLGPDIDPYRYVENDSITQTDPSGQAAEGKWVYYGKTGDWWYYVPGEGTWFFNGPGSWQYNDPTGSVFLATQGRGGWYTFHVWYNGQWYRVAKPGTHPPVGSIVAPVNLPGLKPRWTSATWVGSNGSWVFPPIGFEFPSPPANDVRPPKITPPKGGGAGWVSPPKNESVGGEGESKPISPIFAGSPSNLPDDIHYIPFPIFPTCGSIFGRFPGQPVFAISATDDGKPTLNVGVDVWQRLQGSK